MSILNKIKYVFPVEYNEVKRDSVFSHVLAIHENCLGYSARLVHSMFCRQLDTDKKHELWFVFGGRPLRFSMQEFYAVTGLKYKDDTEVNNLGKWKDDNGFWSKLLKRKGKISIKALLENYLGGVKNWNKVDRVILMYVCVIVGVIMAQDFKREIPHKYIELVIDIGKVLTYPWGLEAFDLLVTSIITTRSKLKNSQSYFLDGFSYAFQISVMETIPVVGALLGEKLNNEFTGFPRCSNWRGAAKVSYEDIIQLENTLGIDDFVYPYTSSTGNFDVYESSEFLWEDEEVDVRVDNLARKIRAGIDFADHLWRYIEYVESTENLDERVGSGGKTLASSTYFGTHHSSSGIHIGLMLSS